MSKTITLSDREVVSLAFLCRTMIDSDHIHFQIKDNITYEKYARNALYMLDQDLHKIYNALDEDLYKIYQALDKEIYSAWNTHFEELNKFNFNVKGKK